MKSVVTFLIVSIFSYCTYSQVSTITKYCDIEIYEIENNKLESILDSILSIEKTKQYYNPDIYYNINFESDSVFQIHLKQHLFTTPNGKPYDFGVLLYGGHSFFLKGVKDINNILISTNKKKGYKYFTNSAFSSEKGDLTFIISRDDGYYAIWTYRYSDGKFELIKFSDTVNKR